MDNNDDDFFNKNFDGLTNSLINELVDSTPSEKRKNKKCIKRASKLSNPQCELILKNRSLGWSYQRLANACKKFPGCEKLNKRTVWTFLKSKESNHDSK